MVVVMVVVVESWARLRVPERVSAMLPRLPAMLAASH